MFRFIFQRTDTFLYFDFLSVTDNFIQLLFYKVPRCIQREKSLIKKDSNI